MVTTDAKITGIDATYYYVKDYDRALAFYRETLGLEPTMSMPGMFAEFTFPAGETFGIYKGQEFSPSAGVMFALADFDNALGSLKSRGVEIADQTEDLPTCRMAFAKDTEGNSFILHQRKV